MSSSLYHELSAKELTDIMTAALHTEVLSAKLLTGGMFNTTYLVETPEYGKIVLRVGPVNRHLLMPYEHHLIEAEDYVCTVFAEHGIPASEILAKDISKTIVNRDFMIVRYIPSKPMSEVILVEEDKNRISREVGVAAAKIHEITALRFGRIADVKNGGGFSLWSEAMFNELNGWEQVAVPTGIFTEAEHNDVRRIFEKAVPYLDEVKVPHLVHADLWRGNILIRSDGEKPEFAAIIDADRAIWGDPLFEFSTIGWVYKADSFWDGYGRRLSQNRSEYIRCKIYALLNRLCTSYVYLVQYDQPKDALVEQTQAREQISELITLLE